MAVPFMETLYAHTVGEFTSKPDVLVWALHSYLVHYGLKCVGISDTKLADCSGASESLPKEWKSQGPQLYTLQYIKASDSSQYVVKVLSVSDGDQVIINVLRFSDNVVATIQVDTSSVVSTDYTSFTTAFIDLDAFKQQLESSLAVMGWFASMKTASDDQTTSRKTREQTTDDRPAGPQYPSYPSSYTEPQPNPLDVGRSDLDPFGFRPPGVGGGMHMRLPRPSPILDPSTGLPQRLPPGAVPPGARFDPFGPPGTGSGHPDHMRPPPDDDYYM